MAKEQYFNTSCSSAISFLGHGRGNCFSFINSSVSHFSATSDLCIAWRLSIFLYAVLSISDMHFMGVGRAEIKGTKHDGIRAGCTPSNSIEGVVHN